MNHSDADKGEELVPKRKCVIVTPEMIIGALIRLKNTQSCTGINDIIRQISCNFPVSTNRSTLYNEISLKLQCCIDLGFLVFKDDQYELARPRSIPYLTTEESSQFWKRYHELQSFLRCISVPWKGDVKFEGFEQAFGAFREACCIFGRCSDDDDSQPRGKEGSLYRPSNRRKRRTVRAKPRKKRTIKNAQKKSRRKGFKKRQKLRRR